MIKTLVSAFLLAISTIALPSQERWSDPNTWEGSPPQAGEDVIIESGRHILLDVHTPSLGSLIINGRLTADVAVDVSLTANSITIPNKGVLQIGSAASPYTHKAIITLTGPRSIHTARVEDNGLDNDGISRGLMVYPGGTLILHGQVNGTQMTKLDSHAQPGVSTFTLVDSVSWQQGDMIAVSKTDFYNVGDTETFTLTQNTTGNTVTVNSPLQSFRWGELQYPLDTPVNGNGISLAPGTFTPPNANTPLVIDERAEVINLTRNIVIQGANDADWTNQGFGAHVMIMGLNSTAQIDGVEFRNVGQRRALGRYPIHWHMLSYNTAGTYLGDVDPTKHYLKNSTIYKSENRAVTIHGTCGLLVEDTFAVDVKGHAMFLEDGSERRNTLSNCVVMKVRNPAQADRIKIHDGESSGFWITNPDNIIVSNYASDCISRGFWNTFALECFGLSRNVSLVPKDLAINVIAYNTAHSCEIGMTTEFPVADEAGNIHGIYYNHTNGDAIITNSVLWKNNSAAYTNRVTRPIYLFWTVADNNYIDVTGAVQLNAEMEGSLFASFTQNNANVGSEPRRRALASYHTAMDMKDITFINYTWYPPSNGVSTPNSQEGQFTFAGGAFDTADFYLHPIELGLIRSPGWKFVNSNPGYITPSPYFDGFPLMSPLGTGYRHWTISGARWDPHGYWGPAGNYLVPDNLFYTYGLTNSVPIAPAGLNGISTSDMFYGLGSIYSGNTIPPAWAGGIEDEIRVERLDTNNNVVAEQTVGDGATTSIFVFRHFGVTRGGRYKIVIPAVPLPTQVFTCILDNAYRPSDSVVLALPWDGTVPVNGREEAGPTSSKVFQHGNSLNDVLVDVAGNTMWLDTTNNLVWVKHVGNLNFDMNGIPPLSNEGLWRHHQIILTAQ